MKTITTIFFALGLLLASLFASAQSKSYKIYNTFADEEGVSSFSFTKDMVDAFDIDIDDDEGNAVVGDLKEIRLMSYNPEKGTRSGERFLDAAIAMLPSRYKHYKAEGEEASNTEIWLLGKKKKYSECHVFVANANPEGNCFVISFYGNFRIDDLQKLEETGRDMAR